MKSFYRVAATAFILAGAQAATAADGDIAESDVAVEAEAEAAVESVAAVEAVEPVETVVETAVAAPAVVPGFVDYPPPGMGQVVFFRKGGLIGAAISCAASENGERITRLPPGKYAVVPATPGIHEYSVKSEAKDILRLEIEDGETYFSECSIKMGLFAGRPNLAPVDQPRFVELSPKLKPVEVEDQDAD